MTNFMRMLSGNVSVNVFKSDAVIWWAAIFRTPSSMFDKMLRLSMSQGSATSRLRSHDLRETISNLLTVSMHLQDSLSKFHRPGLNKIDLRVHVASAPARALGFHESQSCQVSSCTSCLIGLIFRYPRKLHLILRYPRKLHQPVPSTRIHQNSDKPCSVSWKKHTRDTTCFQQNP